MVSPLISQSSCTFTKPLRIVPSTPIWIAITVTPMFHWLFLWQGLSSYLTFCFFKIFTLWSARTAKFTIRQVFFLFLFFFFFFFFFFFWWLSLSLVVWPRLRNLFYLKILKNFCVLFSWMDSGLCIYHLFWWSNLNILHNSPGDQLFHKVVSTLIIFSRWFAAFAYYVIKSLLLFYSLEFFTAANADGFSLEFEWQQVSSSFQDSSQDSMLSFG